MQKNKLDFSNKLILCFYEGNAEKEILEILIENDKIIINEGNLYSRVLHKRICVKNIERKYLNIDVDEEIVILRVIDSKKEQFNLSKPYSELYKKNYKIVTSPEIEILVIIMENDYSAFQKVKSNQKACEFCFKNYGYNKSKKREYIRNKYSVDQIVNAIKFYNKQDTGNEYNLFDLLK